MRRRGADARDVVEDVNMKLPTARLVYCLFCERKVGRGIARWWREGGMWIWMGVWGSMLSVDVRLSRRKEDDKR